MRPNVDICPSRTANSLDQVSAQWRRDDDLSAPWTSFVVLQCEAICPTDKVGTNLGHQQDKDPSTAANLQLNGWNRKESSYCRAQRAVHSSDQFECFSNCFNGLMFHQLFFCSCCLNCQMKEVMDAFITNWQTGYFLLTLFKHIHVNKAVQA